MRGKTRKLDELFPIPPTKLSDEDGTGAVAVAACISIEETDGGASDAPRETDNVQRIHSMREMASDMQHLILS